MTRTDTPRADPRIKTSFEVLYAAGREEGTGLLADISYTGAHLEETSIHPKIGSRVRLYVFGQMTRPFELVGHTVRHTQGGFAIAYDRPGPDIRRFVDDTAAIVSVGGRAKEHPPGPAEPHRPGSSR